MTMTPFPPLDRLSPTFKADVDELFGTRVPNFVDEANTMAANLNSIAAGGAYAIPYTFDSSTTVGDPGSGKIRFNQAALQYTATTLVCDDVGADGASHAGDLDNMDAATSVVKGAVRIVKVGDPAKFLTFNVTAVGRPGGYHTLTVVNVGGGAATPFANGDAVVLQFQRTGDKGDMGPPGTFPAAKFSDRKTNGTAGGVSTSVTVTQTRTLNTTDYNTVTGASLSSNQVTLPAGTYDVFGRAPAVGVTAHRSALYNVTDSTYPLIGSSASTGSTTSNGLSSDSVFTGRITLAAAKTFTIRHWTGSTGGNTAELGQPSSGSGQLEVYTEVIFTKVA